MRIAISRTCNRAQSRLLDFLATRVATGARLAATLALAAACNSSTQYSEPRYEMPLKLTRYFGPDLGLTISADSSGLKVEGSLDVASPCYDQISAWVEGQRPVLVVTIGVNFRTSLCQHVLARYLLSGAVSGIPPGTYKVRIREAALDANPIRYSVRDSTTITIP